VHIFNLHYIIFEISDVASIHVTGLMNRTLMVAVWQKLLNENKDSLIILFRLYSPEGESNLIIYCL